MAISTRTQLILQIVFGFCYHLAFAISFLVDIGRTDPDDCIYPCLGVARASAAYFLYMAIYTLGYVLLGATHNSQKLHQNIVTRTVNAILTIPLLLTPIVYISLIYAASRKRACPGLDDSYHAWLIFLFAAVFFGIFLSLITLILYVLHYGTGYKVPGINYTFGALNIAVESQGKGPDYRSV